MRKSSEKRLDLARVKDTRTFEEKRALLQNPAFLMQIEAEEQERQRREAGQA